MEIKDVYREVKSLPIDSVLSRYVALHKRAGHYEILCPFHNDKSMGSFVIRPSKNRWDCYCCGKGVMAQSLYPCYYRFPKERLRYKLQKSIS